MSLGAFLPLEFYEIVWEADVLVLLRVFGKIQLWSHLGPWLLFVRSFLITASISVGVICLSRFSDSSWLSFGRLYVSRNLSILSRLSRLLVYNCSLYFLTILCISLVSVVISPLSTSYFIYLGPFSFFVDESG